MEAAAAAGGVGGRSAEYGDYLNCPSPGYGRAQYASHYAAAYPQQYWGAVAGRGAWPDYGGGVGVLAGEKRSRKEERIRKSDQEDCDYFFEGQSKSKRSSFVRQKVCRGIRIIRKASLFQTSPTVFSTFNLGAL